MMPHPKKKGLAFVLAMGLLFTSLIFSPGVEAGSGNYDSDSGCSDQPDATGWTYQ